ncbi:MAG: carboxypeptidase regulatory-like domain-containing protein [Planctomycetes bacterium]|nr:carboxypeptidase regulatory-like domain-containing protein [Planctomycetota bacterium]
MALRIRLARWSAILLAFCLVGQAAASFFQTNTHGDGAEILTAPAEADITENPFAVAGRESKRPDSRRSPLEFRIYNLQKQPLRGASVMIKDSEGLERLETGADGIARGQNAGTAATAAIVALAGFEIQILQLKGARPAAPVECTLSPAGPFRGVAVDDGGEPVTGAEVSIVCKEPVPASALPAPVFTDIRGEFEFSHAPRRATTLLIRKAGHVTAAAELDPYILQNSGSMNDGFGKMQDSASRAPDGVVKDSAETFHFSLPAAGAFEGVVRDTKGRPAKRCRVVVVDLDNVMGATETRSSATTDDGGVFRFSDVLPGRRVLVRVFALERSFDSEPLVAAACETCAVSIEIPATTAVNRGRQDR